MSDERTTVLVVGAGLAGCSAALFLAHRGVDVLLVERHPGTSIHPRATGQFPRTMELLRVAGVADEIMAVSYGLGRGLTIKVAESVRGTVFHTIVQGNQDLDTSAISPAPFGMASQDQVEPILLAKAEHKGARVRFGTEVVSFEQDPDGVTARLLDRRNGRLTTVRADYVVAADGHRSPFRETLGIPRYGKGALSHAVGVIFDVDLTRHIEPDSVALYYLQNPAFTGVFINTAVPNRHLFSFDYHPERGESVLDFTTERVTELIRIGLDDPTLEPAIKVVQEWEIAANIAERFAVGRIFLAGDAAKVTPPTGGMGGNTAICDGYDIAWKLADVLAHVAGPGLLDSYDAERRPFAEQVVITSLHNAKERIKPDLDLTGVPEPLDAYRLGFGFRCRSGAVLIEDDDPSLAEAAPSARPGFRAPHVAVAVNGFETSTVHLFGDGWVLIAGTDGTAWQRAAERAATVFGMRLTSYRLGAEVTDPTGQLATTYGIGDAGASLIRPDGVVAWRSGSAGDDNTLIGVLSRLLDRADITVGATVG
ncbi:MAG TPA: FAD-dependent oxidoreductase [Pseudonocardiaceae bacterium]|nr:FAD-dependent oxidoreductase [Pseudonocardiaceae bacterium]